MVKRKGKEFIYIQMEINMKACGLKTENTEKVFTITTLKGRNMMVNGQTGINLDKEFIYSHMVISILAHGIKI